ncbi:MAG: hypothetical protein E7564_10610 [Ruminococcaceae bacterium]|nr:hypothetical protein [Oscillospiraceae bacterium]
MKKLLLKYLPFTTVLILAFYLLPLFIKDTGSAMFILLISIPLVTVIASFIHGIKYGFDLILPLIAAVLFLPTIFIFYNDSALIYVLIFAAITIFGNAISVLFRKK